MTPWTHTSDLLAAVQDARARLVAGETPVDSAHAEARLLGVGAKVLALRLDHARLTGRLEQGSDVLPDVRIGGGEGG